MSRAKLSFCILILAALYLSGYAFSRWRYFIVMYDRNVKEEWVSVRTTGPGHDVRTTSRGRAKNLINPYVYYLFLPVAKVEDLVRGGRTPY